VRSHSHLEFPRLRHGPEARPALATGCNDGLQASPYGPLINLLWPRSSPRPICPGRRQLRHRQANAIAETLVSDPRVDKLSFTGSVATGKKIMGGRGEDAEACALELGGKSGRDLPRHGEPRPDRAQAAGPSSFMPGRLRDVDPRPHPRDAHDTLVQKMVDFVRGMVKVGDPPNPSTFLGP